MRKAPTLRNNNGALQVRVRLDGKDHFINRLGRFEDPIARERAQAIAAKIWRDYHQGQLDWSLCRYKPLVEGKDPDLLKALEALMERKRQGRTTHTRIEWSADTAGHCATTRKFRRFCAGWMPKAWLRRRKPRS